MVMESVNFLTPWRFDSYSWPFNALHSKKIWGIDGLCLEFMLNETYVDITQSICYCDKFRFSTQEQILRLFVDFFFSKKKRWNPEIKSLLVIRYWTKREWVGCGVIKNEGAKTKHHRHTTKQMKQCL